MAETDKELRMQLGGLIVGLGNPGPEYRDTRHNFGFMTVEALLEECGRTAAVNRISGLKDPYALWRTALDDARGLRRDWFVLTPLNYMNRSGDAVQRVSAYYHVDPADILVIHDELDLPLGRMKLKQGGGNAGHNGLRSIQQMLGTPDYYRLRLGIGKAPGRDGASWVLGRFNAGEREALDKTLRAAVQGLELYMRQGPRKAQQFCNGFSLEPPPAPTPASREDARENTDY